jgi:hypothetical protein
VEFIYNDIKKIMSKWTRSDVYAVSFFVYDKNDDPTMPTLTVGYNTIEQMHNESSRGFTTFGEAKWNYAFWLQNKEYLFGHDDITTNLVREWVAAQDLTNVNNAITEAFIDMLIEVSLLLHNKGVIIKVFGKEVPIIIHELEYYEAIASQNRKANPSGAIEEFLQWMDNEILNHDITYTERFESSVDIDTSMNDTIEYMKAQFEIMAQEGKIRADIWEEYKNIK